MECSSEIVQRNGTNVCVHTWTPSATGASSSTTAGLVIVFHGFLAHGRYPTVRYAAERLCAQNYTVVAADFRGHGQSGGLAGYLPSRETVIQDGVDTARHAMEQHTSRRRPTMKTFLLGSSMGGTIALSVAQALSETNGDSTSSSIAGVVLLAPMLKLSVSAPARALLSTLSKLGAGSWQVIPSSSTNANEQYRDATKRKECEDDSKSKSGNGSGKIRIGSASTCVELANQIQDSFDRVTVPFLVMVADEDVVVDIQGNLDLMEKSPSADKTMKRYPALHGLLCEPSPLVDTIHKDLLQWIQARS